MAQMLDYFAEFSDVQKFLWILICLVIFWLMELLLPRFSFVYNKWKHARINFVFLGTTIIINILMAALMSGVFLWTSESSFGLLHLLSWPVWLELLLAFMLLDLVAQYFSHYLLHKVRWMWKFHMVHHSDTHVDVTTGTRHHPGDYLIRELFSLVVILLTGMPLSYYLIYRLSTVLFTYWTHANIRMPLWLDKSLSWIVVTPDMHKFHHHFERPWTDTNFGNILSIWDRLFGTLVYEDPSSVRYGLDVLQDDTSDDLWYQMFLPFDRSVKTD